MRDRTDYSKYSTLNDFKHIIVTRFNLPKRWNTDKMGAVVLDKVWLEERFYLFENFCLPSICGQTRQNFEWWVYFDLKTDNSYKRRIEELEKKHKNLKAKFVKSYDDFQLNMPCEIHRYVSGLEINWLITTRLDNDDMLAKDTIEVIQKKRGFLKEHLVEIPFGYTIELNLISKVRRVESRLNPFISYVEKIKPDPIVKTVYHYQHTEWKGVESIIATTKPQWAQIIHEKNLLNKAIGQKVYPFRFQSRFNLDSRSLKFDTSFRSLGRFLIEYLKKNRPIGKVLFKSKSIFKR